MKRGAIALLLMLLCVWLVGCQAISEAVRGELETMSQSSERSAEIETVAATVSVPTPMHTPILTPTPRGRGAAPAPTADQVATPMVQEPTPEPVGDLRQECVLLWDLMLAGQNLVDEWHLWIAEDPPSPQAHELKLEQFARRWESHANRAAQVGVEPRFEPIREAYVEAVRTYWGSALLALETLKRSDQRTGPQAEELAERANGLWLLAYDQIDALCSQAQAGEAPLPTVAAPKVPQATAAP
jgi:hypothetical protein